MGNSVGQVSRLTAWLLILLAVSALLESRRVKWLSYCHFDIGKQSFLIESLRCDKCYTFYEDDDDDNELIQEDMMTVYDDYVAQESLESYLLNRTQYDYIIARHHERTSLTEMNICKYYESKSAVVFKKWHHEYQTEREETEPPLLPIVSKEWFDLDLLYLIKKGEILTNLNEMDLNYFADLAKNIKSVELINLGIDKVEPDAFVKFESLKRLRISYNNLHYLNISSLFAKTEIYMSKVRESRLEEIELSYNKLTNIFLDSSVYFSSLKVLNVSNNLMKSFDPSLTATVMPSLKQLDLSFNLIKKFPLFKNYLIAASSLVSSSIVNHITSTEAEFNKTASNKLVKDRIKIKIKSSVVLHTLNLLNLNGNNLYSFADLFSLNLMLINDSRFDCDLKNSSISTKQPPKVILSNNRWRCDCNSFEIISSMRFLTSSKSIMSEEDAYIMELMSFSAEKYSNSCYLFNLVEQNKLLFGEIFSNLSLKHLTCAYTNAYDISQKTSWPSWYYQNCISSKDKETRLLELKRVFMSTKQPSTHTTSTSLRPTSRQFSSSRTTMVFIMQHSTRSHVNNVITPPFSSSIRPHNFLKYDSYLSVLFFWIVCALIIILPFSCFFILWFYCCKKCKLYRDESSRRRHMNSIRGLSRMASVRENPRLESSRSFRNQPTTSSSNNLGLFYLSAANNAAFAASNNIYFDQHDQVSNVNDAEDYEDPPSYYDVISLKNVNLSMPHSLKGVSVNPVTTRRINDQTEIDQTHQERVSIPNRNVINVISNEYRCNQEINRQAQINQEFMNQFEITEHTIV